MKNSMFLDKESILLVIHHDKNREGDYDNDDHDNNEYDFDDYSTPNTNRVDDTTFTRPGSMNK